MLQLTCHFVAVAVEKDSRSADILILSRFSGFGCNFQREATVSTFSAVVEKCADTGLYVGYVPGFPGAHTQALTLDEL